MRRRSRRARARSCPCTTRAWRARWTRSSTIAQRHGLVVIEDAAQGISAFWRGRPLGTLGELGCLSFHETKNLTCGEGGALLVNRADWVERAEILQEKGTNRSQFLRGQVDKYTWVDLGSSFLTSEINAAFLWAQIQHAQEILARRMAIWETYHERFAALEERDVLRRPTIPADCTHNAHMYYLLLPSRAARDRFIKRSPRGAWRATSTTSRCTPPPPVSATAVRTGSCR